MSCTITGVLEDLNNEYESDDVDAESPGREVDYIENC